VDGNSSKPDENTIAQLSALAIALKWLDGEGSASRPGHLLKTLVTTTQEALRSGQPLPAMESGALAEIWRQEEAPRSSEVAPLRSGVVRKWWQARQQPLRQRLEDEGAELVPVLEVLSGGGRSIPTRYRISFQQVDRDPAVELDEDPGGLEPRSEIVYRIDPARPALWLRLMLGSKPFPVASWRGWILMGSAVLNFLIIALMWWALYTRWATPRPVTTDEFAVLSITAVLSWCLWWATGPVRRLPEQRVTLATAQYLAFGELYGQLRTMPEGKTPDRRRIFSVVRHWGTCPVCSAEVDLGDGRREFPGRLVGKCHDAPSEHVFSFDPVRLTGRLLRPELPTMAQSFRQ